MAETATGTVVRNTGSHYIVETADGRELPAKVKGRFRINGIRTTKNRSAYCTSKSGLHGLARNLAVELGPCHIRVNTVVAGGIKTARYYARPEIQNSPHNKNPLGDIAEFQDIANAAYFLADNEQARIITGAELAVDGGSLAQFVYEEEGIKLSDGTVIAD